jgi:DNA-binding transcriptional ArsR family regulator
LAALLKACRASRLRAIFCLIWRKYSSQINEVRVGRVTGKLQRAESVLGELEKRYPATQYAFVEFLVAHLADVSKTFGGDLQKALVLAVIGQVYLHALRRSGLEPEEFAAALADGASPTPYVTASRLADVTGIPRETVRRKLALLEAAGWITKLPEGSWSLALGPEKGIAVARADLQALDWRGIQRIAGLYADLEGLVTAKG